MSFDLIYLTFSYYIVNLLVRWFYSLFENEDSETETDFLSHRILAI